MKTIKVLFLLFSIVTFNSARADLQKHRAVLKAFEAIQESGIEGRFALRRAGELCNSLLKGWIAVSGPILEIKNTGNVWTSIITVKDHTLGNVSIRAGDLSSVRLRFDHYREKKISKKIDQDAVSVINTGFYALLGLDAGEETQFFESFAERGTVAEARKVLQKNAFVRKFSTLDIDRRDLKEIQMRLSVASSENGIEFTGEDVERLQLSSFRSQIDEMISDAHTLTLDPARFRPVLKTLTLTTPTGNTVVRLSPRFTREMECQMVVHRTIFDRTGELGIPFATARASDSPYFGSPEDVVHKLKLHEGLFVINPKSESVFGSTNRSVWTAKRFDQDQEVGRGSVRLRLCINFEKIP